MLIGNGMFLCGRTATFSNGYPCGFLSTGVPCPEAGPGGVHVELTTLGRGGVGGAAAGAVADLDDALALADDAATEDDAEEDAPAGALLCGAAIWGNEP